MSGKQADARIAVDRAAATLVLAEMQRHADESLGRKVHGRKRRMNIIRITVIHCVTEFV